jgi:hypothetical protein
MANYFYIEIHSKKLTAVIASEILVKIESERLIHNFTYCDGYLKCYTRGLTDISDILNSYGFTNEEVKIEDEFERFWNSLSEEEYKKICEESKEMTSDNSSYKLKYSGYDWS